MERQRVTLRIALILVGIVFLMLFVALAFAQDTPAWGIQKPFTISELSQKVRSRLGEPKD